MRLDGFTKRRLKDKLVVSDGNCCCGRTLLSVDDNLLRKILEDKMGIPSEFKYFCADCDRNTPIPNPREAKGE